VLAAAALAIAPWTVRNATTMHAFVPVSDNGGYTLAGTYNDSARSDKDFRAGWRPAQTDPEYRRLFNRTSGELDASRSLGRAARHFIGDHPTYVAEVAYCNTLRLAFLGWLSCGDRRETAALGYVVEQGTSRTVGNIAIVSFGVVALLALAGAFTRAARRAPRAVWLMPALLWITVFVLTANRFRAPLEPFIIMLASLALVSAFERRRRLVGSADVPGSSAPASSTD
jgi:hypothetical protein